MNTLPMSPPSRQQGAILIVSLIILLVLTIIGAMTLKTGTLQELMAGNAQLVSTNRQAAQTAANSFVAEGSVVFNDSLQHGSNVNTQLLRKAIAKRTNAATPTATNQAVVHCVTSAGATTEVTTATGGGGCTTAANNFSAGGAPIKARRRAFYLDCRPTLCPQGMATSLDQVAGLGCPTFYVEGAGFLDVDGNGLPPAAGNEETAVYEHSWARWKRPVLCEF